MSVRDPRATLRQMREAAARAQEICAGKTLELLLIGRPRPHSSVFWRSLAKR